MLILLEDYLYIFCVIGLGDFFLENLQGLTTLKIYQADQQKAEDDACRMEHIVSDDSIMCLNSFLRNDGRYQRAITGYNPHSRYAVERIPELWEFTRYRRKPVRDDWQRNFMITSATFC
jgi:hypothetical protein